MFTAFDPEGYGHTRIADTHRTAPEHPKREKKFAKVPVGVEGSAYSLFVKLTRCRGWEGAIFLVSLRPRKNTCLETRKRIVEILRQEDRSDVQWIPYHCSPLRFHNNLSSLIKMAGILSLRGSIYSSRGTSSETVVIHFAFHLFKVYKSR